MKRSSISVTKVGAFAVAGHILTNERGPYCQLRQTVTSEGLLVGVNEHQGSLGDLGGTGRRLEGRDSIRTAMFDLKPGVTAAQVEAELAKHPEAVIWYRISDDVRDLLTAAQLAGLASGKNTKSIADYERDMCITNPTTGEVKAGEFRVGYFSATKREDVDLRIRAKVAVPAAAPAELAQAPAVVAAPAAAEVAPF